MSADVWVLGSAKTTSTVPVMEGMDEHTDTQLQGKNCCKISELMVRPSGIASQETGVPQAGRHWDYTKGNGNFGITGQVCILGRVSGHDVLYNAFIGDCDPSLGVFKILVRNVEECFLEFWERNPAQPPRFSDRGGFQKVNESSLKGKWRFLRAHIKPTLVFVFKTKNLSNETSLFQRKVVFFLKLKD